MNSDNHLDELAGRLRQREAELALISSVQTGLLAKLEMQEIYEMVGDRLRDIFDAQVTGIYTFDHETSLEHFQYLFEDGERLYPESRPLNQIRNWIINNRTILLINENADETVENITGDKHIPVPGTRLPKSLVFVPLIVSDKVTGCLSLQSLDREHAFAESDVQLLSTLANSISIALENARLFNETEQRNAELAVINSVQEGLVAEMDMQGIYDLVGDKIRELFDAQVTMIAVFDHENHMEDFKYFFEAGERFYPEPRGYNKIREQLIDHKKLILINEDVGSHITNAVPGTAFPKSMVFVPLVTKETVFGYVSLQNIDHEFAFSDYDVRLLGTLANSMSVALENARLFSETEQRNAELAVINSVQEGLVAEMNMQGIYELVGNRIFEVVNTQTLVIRTFSDDNELEHWEFVVEKGERIFAEPRPLIWANKHLLKTKAPLIINENYSETANKYGGTGVSKGLPPKSGIFVPMIVGDKVMGSISLQNVERENAFTDSDVRLLTTLTNSMSVALENARLFNETTRLLAETEQLAGEMQTVNHISKAMVSQLDLDALIQLVGDQMRDTFKADIVYISLYDKETDMVHFPYEYGDKNESRKFGNGFTERIISSNTPLLINKGIDEIRQQLKSKRIGRVTSSFLGVPIQTGDSPNGVISVQSTEEENRFTEDDLRLLTTIAANVSVALQNAEAYRKLQSALSDLHSAQEQLVQQEKLASLGQLTAGIAHEIKNPLNFVNNFSNVSLEMLDEVLDEVKKFEGERLKGDGEPAPVLDLDLVLEILSDMKINLEKIHEHGTRADGIVKSMLQHSRGGTGKMEPTNLNAMVSEFANLSYHGMRAGKEPIDVQISLDLDDNTGEVPVVYEDFSRVIINICSNAFDAMRGSIQGSGVGDRGLDGPYYPRLTVRTRRNGDRVTIEIEDNGPGIPDDIKDKILQPFFTTKKGTQGTGLGLSITHDIIKAHGGVFRIQTKPGQTIFSISLTA
jgi:GAF domain-containing protein